MLKNSSTLAVSVPINLSTKLGFVSVHSPRETYFLDVLYICLFVCVLQKYSGVHVSLYPKGET